MQVMTCPTAILRCQHPSLNQRISRRHHFSSNILFFNAPLRASTFDGKKLKNIAANPRPRKVSNAISATSIAADASGENQGIFKRTAQSIKTLFTPFSDPSCNRRLLALVLSQTLCSVATLIHDTYLPVYLSAELGLSNTKIGNLQAIAQFLCNASKSLSGTLADILSPAKMVVIGTLLTTLNKPMFALSGVVYAMFGTVACLYLITAGKVFDRMSKGVREAPTKALMGDLAAESKDRVEGAFGLRQAMTTAGGLLGASLAGLAYNLSGKNYTLTFAMATIPAALALLLVTSVFGAKAGDKVPVQKVKEKVTLGQRGEKIVAMAKALMTALKPAYWQALIVVSLLYFARFDASFITLRARLVMPLSQLPYLTSIMMFMQAVCSAPLGIRAKISTQDRNQVLLVGYAAMVGANLCFALIPSFTGMVCGSVLVGLHMAASHGITLAMVSSCIPTDVVPGIGKISGTAWSFTDMVLGLVLAFSNSVAGKLADVTVRMGLGNIGCFMGGGVATILSGIALLIFTQWGDLGKQQSPGTAKAA